jgi:putative PIN family toxin of toxin-antitoxin system
VKTEERYVFDTNVLISALLFAQSRPGQAFFAALERGTILLSQSVLKEVSEVLSRKRFDRYLLQGERESFLTTLISEAELVEITEVIRICRDPKDDMFLELAASGGATYVISGDQDLLQLKHLRGVPIVTPINFFAYLPNELSYLNWRTPSTK